ncbi:MAG: phage minor capsid protein [Acutalibacteraceae bacterium]|nr:phage minor capsid protein [Acutalibacteraceae bacterium]
MNDKDIEQLYREMELMLIDSMKRNLGLHIAEEMETGLDYPQWQAIKLNELRKYRKENAKIIGGATKGLPKEIAKHLREELVQGYESEIEKFRSVIGEDKFKSAVAMNESFFKINTRKVDALIEEVNGSVLKANHATLRMTNDVYRDVIFKSTFFMANGVFTPQQAYDKAMKDFLNRGINCIEYKDGRRVNIADYADMAVRTASKRATLMGAGELRKETGNPLVRISKHNTSCKLCSPFQNKVLIDDVYSGGKTSDGDYMLMSEAMKKGLFHPRCRHGLGTYYPELEDIMREYNDDDDEDVTDYGVHNKAFVENMIQKYKRLALGSVSPENVAKYSAKLKEWESIRKDRNIDNSPVKYYNVVKTSEKQLTRRANRKEANIGAFSGLSIPMQKREVLRICKKYGIDTHGLTFKIQRSEKFLALNFYGCADYDDIGRIDLMPNAFINEEQMVKTILHEKCHVEQLRKYGKKYTQDNLLLMEKEACEAELLYDKIKLKGGVGV